MSWRGLLLVGSVAFGLVHLVPWARTGSQHTASVWPNCEAWGREASQGIATLISDTSPAAELRLDELSGGLIILPAWLRVRVRRDLMAAINLD